jgi:hypothetical protein
MEVQYAHTVVFSVVCYCSIYTTISATLNTGKLTNSGNSGLGTTNPVYKCHAREASPQTFYILLSIGILCGGASRASDSLPTFFYTFFLLSRIILNNVYMYTYTYIR